MTSQTYPPSYQKAVLVREEEENEKATLIGHALQRRGWMVFAVVLLLAAFLRTTFPRPENDSDEYLLGSVGPTNALDLPRSHDNTAASARQLEIVRALRALQTDIQGSVHLFDDAPFLQAARVWSIRSSAGDRAPWAVVEVETEADVRTTIQVLSRLKRIWEFPFSIRSGGHNKAGYSTVARGAVVSLRRMNSISLSPPNDDQEEAAIARMGPAVTAEQFLDQIMAPFGYGGVIGFCGTVAEAGFILGGGLGMQSRIHGLGLDNVVGMRIVLADGSVRHASSDSADAIDRDLFWALRGAGGGSFGVVTELEYRVHKASNRLIFAQLSMPVASDVATFLYRLGQIEAQLPGNILVMHDVVNTASILWTGRDDQEMEGGAEYIDNLIEKVLPPNAPRTFRQAEYEWTTIYRGIGASWSPDVYAASCWYGFLFPVNNTAEIWHDIMEHISRGVNASSGYLVPDIELWGGAIHEKAWNATAFPHRSAIYNVGVLLTVPNDEPNAERIFKDDIAKVNAWWPNVAQYLTGSYVNYPTKTLLHQNYPKVYWGENLPRLVATKRHVDPENIFEFPMSVPMNT